MSATTTKKTPAPLTYKVVIGPKEDLGSRFPMVRRLGKRMAQFRRAKLDEWLGDAAKTRRKRAELLNAVAYQPEAVPLRPRLIREEVLPFARRQHYRLQINPDEEISATLALPLDASPRRPVPVLLGLHEHGGMLPLGREKLFSDPNLAPTFRKYQRRCYGETLPGDFFPANGFAVLTIDQLGFGSRGLWHDDEDAPYRDLRNVSSRADLDLRLRMRYEQSWLHRALLAYGVTESEVSLHDNRRSIDFLDTLPHIDSSRLGAFGLSVGCMWAHHVAAFDSRIKASVRVCWSGDLEMMIDADGPRALGAHFMFPKINGELHVPELVALSDPAAVLIINGRKDPLYPFAAQERTRKRVQEIVEAQGRQDRVRWSYFDGGHAFYPPQQHEALEFFNHFLGRGKSSRESNDRARKNGEMT